MFWPGEETERCPSRSAIIGMPGAGELRVRKEKARAVSPEFEAIGTSGEHKTEFASGRGVMSGGKSERDRPGFAQDDEPDDFGALIVELLAGGTNKDAPVPDTQLLTISPRVSPEIRRSGKRILGAEVLWSC